MNYTKKIKTVRLIKGLTQENVAHELGMTTSNYTKIEKGLVSLNMETLHKIATILGLNILELLSFNEPGSQVQKGNVNIGRDNHGAISIAECENRLKRKEEDIVFLKKTQKQEIELLEQKAQNANEQSLAWRSLYEAAKKELDEIKR